MSAPKAAAWSRLARRNPRERLHAVLKLRGGPEAWVEIEARGQVVRVPGWVSIAEVLLYMNNAT